jgi:hypothetical protein
MSLAHRDPATRTYGTSPFLNWDSGISSKKRVATTPSLKSGQVFHVSSYLGENAEDTKFTFNMLRNPVSCPVLIGDCSKLRAVLF